MSRTIRSTAVLFTLLAGIGLTLAACDRMPTDAGATAKGPKAMHDSSGDSTTCKGNWITVNGVVVCSGNNGND